MALPASSACFSPLSVNRREASSPPWGSASPCRRSQITREVLPGGSGARRRRGATGGAGRRLAEVVALTAVNAQLAEQLDRRLVADELGDRLHAHAVSHRDDSLDHR